MYDYSLFLLEWRIVSYESLDQELLEDPATISAIDEETEFNSLVVSSC